MFLGGWYSFTGEIGTSPLYALRGCFGGSQGVEPTQANVVGVPPAGRRRLGLSASRAEPDCRSWDCPTP